MDVGYGIRHPICRGLIECRHHIIITLFGSVGGNIINAKLSLGLCKPNLVAGSPECRQFDGDGPHSGVELCCITIVIDYAGVPSRSRTVVVDYAGVPSRNRTVVVDCAGVPSRSRTVVVDYVGVPSRSRTVVVDYAGVPSRSRTVVVDYVGVPSRSRTVVVDYAGVPSRSRTVVVDYAGVPSRNRTVVVDYVGVPSRSRTVVVELSCVYLINVNFRFFAIYFVNRHSGAKNNSGLCIQFYRKMESLQLSMVNAIQKKPC